jgi:hypothetical protein
VAFIARPAGTKIKLSLNKNVVPPSNYKDVGIAVMHSENERVELAMQIMKYRRFLVLIVDEQFQQTAKEKIAKLEQQLREIVE